MYRYINVSEKYPTVVHGQLLEVDSECTNTNVQIYQCK